MAESAQERTEAPTPKRRQEARDEGRVPHSVEFGTAVLFLGAAAVVNVAAPAASARIMDLFGNGLRHIGDAGGSAEAAIMRLQVTGRDVLGVIVMLTGGLAAAALGAGALQGRGVLTMKPLMPDWSRINPVSNAARLIGVRAVADLVKSLLKVLIVGWAVWRALSLAWPDVIDLAGRGPGSLLEAMRHYSVKLLVTAGGVFLVLAAADYAYQLWEFQKSLRMSKEDVRQELKQQDGDPLLKARMRSAARSRVRRQMFQDVAKADVVVVNPTHIAVALRYDPDRAPAPIVLAMGQRRIAERIKALAHQHGVPVIENRPLARALLASARVGSIIPAALYAAVAEVLAFIVRQRALVGQWPRWMERATA
ncbi:MAG: flagellar biosynthesis protein FlhB [Gemmatimonas sp.]|nr:flagellar biosynthesis protein FlhB [Gemmatimonas sp.]